MKLLSNVIKICVIFACVLLSPNLLAQQELTTAQIESTNNNQTATSGELYLDIQEDLLYMGLDNGTLRKISDKRIIIDDEPLPEVTNPLIYLDTSTSSSNSTNYTTVKSFTLPGNILKTQNAVKMVFYKRRTSNSGSVNIRLKYGGQTLFTTGSLGNAVGRVEMILFSTGNTNSQRAYIDDANTGNNGQRTGTSSINSEQDQLVEIQVRTNNTSSNFSFDFLSAEGLIFE